MSDEGLVQELQRLSTIGEMKKKEREEKALVEYLKREFDSIKNQCHAAASRGERGIFISDKQDTRNGSIASIPLSIVRKRFEELLTGMGFKLERRRKDGNYIYQYDISW